MKIKIPCLKNISPYLSLPIFLVSIFGAFFTYKGYNDNKKLINYFNEYPRVSINEVRYNKESNNIIVDDVIDESERLIFLRQVFN